MEKESQATPIRLSMDEAATGLGFTNRINVARAAVESATEAERQFVDHLRKVHKVPEGWVLKDWVRGFEPPAPGAHQHE